MEENMDDEKESARLKLGIKSSFSYLSFAKDIHPDYVDDEVERLQATVLASHARLERSLETRMIIYLKSNLPEISTKSETWVKIASFSSNILQSVSFWDKVRFVEGLQDGSSEAIKMLHAVNKYRNEFAHPNGFLLNQKYSQSTIEGLAETDKMLKTLVKAEAEMDSYFKILPK